MRQRLAWSDLQLVLVIGREGSLSGAARVLSLDHSTIHRRIGRIEADLGARLFERSRTGYAPTPAGEEALALASRVEDELAAFETKLAGQDMRPSGTVRITTSDTLLVGFLTQVLADLRRAHPQIIVEVVSTATALDLAKREADIAVRVSDTPPEHLVGRRIGTVETAIYASADYIARHSSTGDLAAGMWIGYGEALAHLEAARWLKAHVPAECIIYRVDTVLGAQEAALAGMGMAVLPDAAASNLIAVQPAPMAPFQTALWLLTHRDLRHTARIRTVMDFLAEEVPRARAANQRSV